MKNLKLLLVGLAALGLSGMNSASAAACLSEEAGGPSIMISSVSNESVLVPPHFFVEEVTTPWLENRHISSISSIGGIPLRTPSSEMKALKDMRDELMMSLRLRRKEKLVCSRLRENKVRRS